MTVPRGSSTEIAVELEPTPQKRAAYVSSARARRTWSWISIGAGAAIAAGGTVFLIWNAGEKSDAEASFDRIADESERGSGLRCDPAEQRPASCEEELQLALDNLETARDRDKLGWIGVGAGAAGLALGVVLLATGDDPERYDPRPESDVFGLRRARPITWAAPGGGGIGVSGAF